MAWTMDRPKPEPLALVVKNGSKMRSRVSAGMPVPLSSLESSASRPLKPTENDTCPPLFSASIALRPREVLGEGVIVVDEEVTSTRMSGGRRVSGGCLVSRRFS
jgi:hypothetical protein